MRREVIIGCTGAAAAAAAAAATSRKRLISTCNFAAQNPQFSLLCPPFVPAPLMLCCGGRKERAADASSAAAVPSDTHQALQKDVANKDPRSDLPWWKIEVDKIVLSSYCTEMFCEAESRLCMLRG